MGLHRGDAAAVQCAADGPWPRPRGRRRASGAPSRSRRWRSCAVHYPELAVALPRAIALCAVPLLAGGEVLGAVGVSRSEPRPFAQAEIALLEALGRQGGQALERARLYDRLHRLQATTAALARALTPQEVAATAAAQGAEALGASSAWVALLDEGGRTLELAHAAGHGEATRERFASFSLDAELPLAHAARTVTPLWLESPEAIFGPYPRFAEVRPQAQAAALLPLSDDGRALGAIGLVFDHAHVFRPHDRDYLLALTRLCGQALGRARRYQAEHDLAATLQQALLPEALPDVDGLSLAVRYLPAADGTAAGGDFYEAVELGGGRLGIAVGDVVGHGPEAAAAMGQLRSALRAYALEGAPAGARPAAALALRRRRRRRARGDARLRDRRPGRARAALRLGRASAAAAGHRRGRARASWRTRAACRWTARWASSTRTPWPRCPSSRRSSCTPTARSSGAGSRSTSAWSGWRARPRPARAWSPPRSATRCWSALIDDSRRLRDDVALLVARTLPPVVAPLHLWFAARADQLAVVREAMRTWLVERGRGGGDRELVVLAAGELCANSVEHAYPPGSDAAVEVALAREPGGVLTLVVRDRGRWRPPPADPGDRGRGLGIVRALMHTVDVDPGGEGTTVSARYRPGAAPPAPAGVVGPPQVAVEIVDGVPSRTCRARSTGPTRARSSPSCWRSRPGRWSSTSRGWRSCPAPGWRCCSGWPSAACGSRSSRRSAHRSGARWRLPSCQRVAHVVDSVHLALEDFARP